MKPVGKARSSGFSPGGRYRVSIEFSDHEAYRAFKGGQSGIVVNIGGDVFQTDVPGVSVAVPKPRPTP